MEELVLCTCGLRVLRSGLMGRPPPGKDYYSVGVLYLPRMFRRRQEWDFPFLFSPAYSICSARPLPRTEYEQEKEQKAEAAAVARGGAVGLGFRVRSLEVGGSLLYDVI